MWNSFQQVFNTAILTALGSTITSQYAFDTSLSPLSVSSLHEVNDYTGWSEMEILFQIKRRAETRTNKEKNKHEKEKEEESTSENTKEKTFSKGKMKKELQYEEASTKREGAEAETDKSEGTTNSSGSREETNQSGKGQKK